MLLNINNCWMKPKLIRTTKQISEDYSKFRGKCKEYSQELVDNDPSLTLVRGYYFCPIWRNEEPHWWVKDANGNIIDPTKAQFPSNGYGIYEEFDGYVNCSNCGKELKEDEASFESNYCFCSYSCHGQFVGVL